jgi:hypothetical protein
VSYEIILEPAAVEDLSKLPKPVRDYVAIQLHNLAESPFALSRRSHFQFPQKCQLYSFDYDFGGQRHFMNVLFQFGQNETKLHIIGISWRPADDWWSR